MTNISENFFESRSSFAEFKSVVKRAAEARKNKQNVALGFNSTTHTFTIISDTYKGNTNSIDFISKDIFVELCRKFQESRYLSDHDKQYLGELFKLKEILYEDNSNISFSKILPSEVKEEEEDPFFNILYNELMTFDSFITSIQNSKSQGFFVCYSPMQQKFEAFKNIDSAKKNSFFYVSGDQLVTILVQFEEELAKSNPLELAALKVNIPFSGDILKKLKYENSLLVESFVSALKNAAVGSYAENLVICYNPKRQEFKSQPLFGIEAGFYLIPTDKLESITKKFNKNQPNNTDLLKELRQRLGDYLQKKKIFSSFSAINVDYTSIKAFRSFEKAINLIYQNKSKSNQLYYNTSVNGFENLPSKDVIEANIVPVSLLTEILSKFRGELDHVSNQEIEILQKKIGFLVYDLKNVGQGRLTRGQQLKNIAKHLRKGRWIAIEKGKRLMQEKMKFERKYGRKTLDDKGNHLNEIHHLQRLSQFVASFVSNDSNPELRLAKLLDKQEEITMFLSSLGQDDQIHKTEIEPLFQSEIPKLRKILNRLSDIAYGDFSGAEIHDKISSRGIEEIQVMLGFEKNSREVIEAKKKFQELSSKEELLSFLSSLYIEIDEKMKIEESSINRILPILKRLLDESVKRKINIFSYETKKGRILNGEEALKEYEKIDKKYKNFDQRLKKLRL